MNITRTSIFSDITRTIDLPVTREQLALWESGTLIQRAMPQLSKDEREFVMTGVTAQEWAGEFVEGDGEFLVDSGPDADFGADEIAPMSDNELDDLATEYDL